MKLMRFLQISTLLLSTLAATSAPTPSTPPTSSPSPSLSGNNQSLPIIVGAAIGIPVAAIFLGVMAFWILSRRINHARSLAVDQTEMGQPKRFVVDSSQFSPSHELYNEPQHRDNLSSPASACPIELADNISARGF